MKEKYNEINHIRNELNLPIIQLVQTHELRKDQEEGENLYANMLQFKKLVEDINDEINELGWNISLLKM